MTTNVGDQTETYRRELTAHCYRMLGSSAEAEDAVQETMLRAWRSGDEFEGRSSLRSWLYRIATNVCIDMTRAPQRRALPVDLGGPSAMTDAPDIGTPLEATRWIEPIHDASVLEAGDPADATVQRDTIRLAFVAALATLPPQQRAILLLREVLQWSAAETAELLDTTVEGVNSALARARAAMKKRDSGDAPLADDDRELLDKYVAAFSRYDVDGLVALLQHDAEFSMPPYEFWLRGAADIARWWDGPGRYCENARVLLTRANGGPAVAVYHHADVERWEPFAIHVLDVRDGRIAAITHFLDPSLFPRFGLPDVLTA